MEAILVFPLTGVEEAFPLPKPALLGKLPPWEYDPVEDLIKTFIVLFNEYNLVVTDSPLQTLLHVREGRQAPTPDTVAAIAAQCSNWMAQHVLLRDVARKTPSGTLLDLVADQCYIRVEQQLNLFSSRRASLRSPRGLPELTYGELNSMLVRELILDKYCNEGSFFVDFGSGIGNVVLLAAMKCARAVGVECQPHLHQFAVAYKKAMAEKLAAVGFYEYSKKVSWDTQLILGDFLSDAVPLELLRNADLVLVNNLTFPPTLNHNLVLRFLDLKAGAYVISLVPLLRTRVNFGTTGTTSSVTLSSSAEETCPRTGTRSKFKSTIKAQGPATSRRANHNPSLAPTFSGNDIAAAIFEPHVERIPYGAGMVSWAAAAGTLFVHRVKVKPLY